MSRKKKSNACIPTPWDSAQQNNWTYQVYYYQLLDVAINSYEWLNLPQEIDPRFLELMLNTRGYCLFFWEDIVETYAVMEAAIGGILDIYRIPEMRTAYAVNGYTRTYSNLNSVLMFNNFLRSPTVPTLMFYAKKLYEIDRTIDTNVKGQKYPIMIQCSESERLSMKNLYMQYDGNEPFIFGNDDLDIKKVQAINTGSPFVAPDLYSLKKQYWYEALTYLGIETSNTDKKERLVSDEIIANNNIVMMQKETRLNARKESCRQINNMFGINLDVRYRDLSMGVITENEQIHDGAALDSGDGVQSGTE